MEHNIFRFEELQTLGHTSASVRDLVETGQLTRLRRGWYAQLGAGRDAVAAIKAGAHLGCLSGCKAHGLWVPPFEGVHAVYGRGRKPGGRPGIVLHRTEAPAPTSAVWPLLDCLMQVIKRHDLETCLIVVESAVERRLIGHEEAGALVRRTPHGDLRRYLARARSGSETRVRLFFQMRGVQVQSLVPIPTIGEVDMKVGSRLLVECDSEAHHTSLRDRFNDGTRDLNAHLGRYDHIRLSYRQIWDDWPATQAALSQVLKQRRHLYRPRHSTATTPRGMARARHLGLPFSASSSPSRRPSDGKASSQ